MNAVFQLRYALRVVRRHRRSAFAVVLLFGLGIGATSTMFAALYEIVLSPLPVKHPDRMVLIAAAYPPTGDPIAWWGQCQALQGLCLVRSGGVNLAEGIRPERVAAAAVSPNFFSVFDVAPQLGRLFIEPDGAAGHDRVVVLNYRLWARLFGRAPSVVGRSIALNGVAYSVVGVAPSGFDFPGRADVWIPVANGSFSPVLGHGDQPDLPPSLRFSAMVGRLKDGSSITEANSQMRVLMDRLRETYSESKISFGGRAWARPLLDAFVGQYRSALYLLFAAVALLLGVGCANAASLMLARAASRQKEIAILLSFGASRATIVGQLLMESITLSALGGVAGVMLSYLGVGVVRLWGPAQIPRLSDLRVDAAVVIFGALTSLIAGTVVGMTTAVAFRGEHIMDSLRDDRASGGSGSLGRRARTVAVVMEIGLAFVLLIEAGLSARSFINAARVAPGFKAEKALAMRLSLPEAKYGEPAVSGDNSGRASLSSKYRAPEFYERLLTGFTALPGVTAAGAISYLPLADSSGGSNWVEPSGAQGGMAQEFTIEGEYFAAMGIPIMSGRSFTEAEARNSGPAAIVSSSLAQLCWNGRNAVGQQIKIGSERIARQVVGVAGDAKYGGLATDIPQVYLPAAQRPSLDMVLIVRTLGDPRFLAQPLEDQVTALDESLPVFRVRTLDDLVSESLSDYRFRALLLGVFGLLSALIASGGVYSMVSYSVNSRRREIGVRMSLGAGRKDILLMVIRETAILAFVGVGIGTLGALASGRLISSLLFGVLPTDTLTMAGSAFLLLAAALGASVVPAIAATRIDPASALRSE
ncbi:MAG TPA: ABC transporter permease [Blastocatellia bacterium]|nr:ABC transporter permease [Blastocatellia bacterium]